jgi:hypothetical protein
MFNRLMNHLNKHAILSPNQYGFQKNVSTDNAVYSLLYKILTTLNDKSKAKEIFCDTEKVFVLTTIFFFTNWKYMES